ncbi:DUF460 domain-containing protein [Candidatus Woesearchaeota archaeon]|nr:DUF460 domain-containing protein [Candidatus Woesearchaeota archaeon]
MEKKLTIVGIDPGTTTAYSVLDIDGNLLKTGSSKNMGLSQLIEAVISEGKPMFAGTDKANVPSLVSGFASNTGAKVVHPQEDLKSAEKSAIADRPKTNNEHEFDALASSVFAYNKIKNFIARVDAVLKAEKKENLRLSVLELSLGYGISIRNAISIIEKPENEESRIVSRAVIEKKLSRNDFVKLYNKVKMQQREISFLRKQNSSLKGAIKSLEHRNIKLANKKPQYGEKAKELIIQKEKRVLSISRLADRKEEEKKELAEKIGVLEKVMSDKDNYYALKKLKNLGKAEILPKIGEIAQGDMLFVESPSSYSDEAVKSIRDKVSVILTREQVSKKLRREMPFVFLNVDDFGIIGSGSTLFIRKGEVDGKLDKMNLLNKIVEEYRKEKLS